MRATIAGSSLALAVLVSAAASARPPDQVSAPRPARDAEPVVGRVKMRDQVVPLTRSSLAEGGAARELREAFAHEVMADIEDERWKPKSER